MTTQQQLDDTVFQEKDGLLVVEIESVPLAGVFSREASYAGIWNEWVAETDHDGFTGECYYRWGGPDVKWNPGSGILRYSFHIENPGRYLFAIRNRHDNEDKSESNDAFVRVDGGQWYKTKSRVHRQWTWSTWYERSHELSEPCWHDLEAGLHTIEICGRSNSFCLDRFFLAKEGVDGEDVALPQSDVRRSA
jgi:hypothetical protein